MMKIYVILSNFFFSIKLKEVLELFLAPLILTILICFLCNTSIYDFSKFISEFNSTVINITAILGAFSLASLSIIITSSNTNIDKAKEEYTNRLDRNRKFITYYKLQILRNFFSLFLLFGLLIYAIIFIFLQNVLSNLCVLFYIEVYLLLVSLIAQIFVIQSMYFLFVEPKK